MQSSPKWLAKDNLWFMLGKLGYYRHYPEEKEVDPKELHPDYISIDQEIMSFPASITREDWSEFVWWIFINRLLYGMDWGRKYTR